MKSLLQACKHLHPCVNSVWKQWDHQQLPQTRYPFIMNPYAVNCACSNPACCNKATKEGLMALI